MRALIVDDEPHARAELERLLAETMQFTIVGRCANAIEALHAIRQERPDVLFLDVQMPGVSGLELLGMIDDDIHPDVVFVTAHEEFAVQAFEESALDYLLKPVEKERLAKTVERLRQRRSEGAPPAYHAPSIKRIPCLAARSIKLVPVQEVEFVKSSEAGVYVVSCQGEFYTELTLSVLEARAGLLRCHKQYLVNIDRIDEISLSENSLAVIKTKAGNTVPVSRRHLAKVREALEL
ncbi:MAG TPA: two-component system response regulator BtsR [Anaeromyxobacteraceae bacterium]|nr:two-component system response regulator BtsR [Anaeromyxobacteraceae bacterium]